MLWIFAITRHFQKCFTDYDRSTPVQQKNVKDYKGVVLELSLPFPGGKWAVWKNVKTSNISGAMQPIFLIFSPCVWENNGLLHNNYLDDLAIIGQGHSKDNFFPILLTCRPSLD